ncbi:Mediator of RNA polymerase II transcription subunit 7 [Ascosphaera acerosa]|nr:Mediator of RNA polymerase II transcription subunit 7 [Ascosphaera acerosa]
MADSAATKPAVTAAFPPPPPFWRYFTRANLRKFEEFKETVAQQGQGQGQADVDGQAAEGLEDVEGNAPARHATASSSSSTTSDAHESDDLDRLRKEVPAELRYLVPPAIPQDTYELFGELQQVDFALPTLASQGIHQVFPSAAPPTSPGTAGAAGTGGAGGATPSGPAELPSDPVFWLTTISKYILLNFLELVGLLASAPEQAREKIDDLRNLFITAHHLLNLLRPHQTREGVIALLEQQIQRSNAEIEEMVRTKERVREALARLEREGRDPLAAAIE